ncbi:MAG: S1C family serine protease [Pseudonocardia sp.]
MRRTLAAVAVLAVVCGGCSSVRDDAESSGTSAVPPAVAAPPAAQPSIPEIVAKVDPSVVTVAVGRSQGSGVVYREGGLVVTNRHVVGNARQVELELADGSTTPAEVLATDEETDLAVLQAERRDLPPATFQREVPPVGALVLAIGSPLGFQNSATAGILSGVGREIPGAAAGGGRALVDLLQTDAAISPGNSGGALLNVIGCVIGINEAYIPPAAGAVSIGFAIPAATAVDIADQLLADGSATHPFLGFSLGRLTPQIRQSLGVDTDGALVLEVSPGGPAAAAGVRPGDVVVGFNGREIASFEDLLSALRDVEPGQQAPIALVRAGQRVDLPLTVGAVPG